MSPKLLTSNIGKIVTTSDGFAVQGSVPDYQFPSNPDDTALFAKPSTPTDSLATGASTRAAFVDGIDLRGWRGLSVSYYGNYGITQTSITGAKPIITTDWGNTWAYAGAGFSWTPGNFGAGSAISPTGQYMLANQFDGYMYYSSDYGVNWGRLALGLAAFRFMNIDLNGIALIADSSYLYRSTNGGATWSTSSPIPVDSSYGGRIASSLGGKQKYIFGSDGVYKSIDFGVTFTKIATYSSPNYVGGDCDDTGQTIFYVLPGAVFKYSQDGGETWGDITSSLAPTVPICAGVSGDGKRIIIPINGSSQIPQMVSDITVSQTAAPVSGATATNAWNFAFAKDKSRMFYNTTAYPYNMYRYKW